MKKDRRVELVIIKQTVIAQSPVLIQKPQTKVGVFFFAYCGHGLSSAPPGSKSRQHALRSFDALFHYFQIEALVRRMEIIFR